MAGTGESTETVTFSVVGAERVPGCGEPVGLAIVELTLHGIAITLQDTKGCRLAGDRITVTLPDFRHTRTDRMRTAIVLPRELSDAIGASVARACDTLGHPTLPSDPLHGVTSSAAALRHSQSHKERLCNARSV